MNPPNRSSERTVARAGVDIPARAARSRRRTPLHVCVVDHPSTQAIGNSAVCCGIASSVVRSSSICPDLPCQVRVSRQFAPVSAGVIAADAAVLLTSKSLGPSPRLRPRGNSSAARRVKPPSVWPAVSTATNSAPPPTSASAPRRLTVGAAGSAATSPSTSGGSGRVSAAKCAARCEATKSAGR